jgi:hypothetical protein
MLALFYSAVIYAAVFLIAICAGADHKDISDAYRGRADLRISLAVGAGIVVLAPLALAYSGARWRSSEARTKVLAWLKISEAHGIQSGWNAMFSRKGTAMIRVVLKSGVVIGGYYGAGSLAGYSEHDGDLFIDQRWELDQDDWFVQPSPESLGVWVRNDEIESVQFYRPFEEPSSNDEETSEPEAGTNEEA